MYLRVSGQSYSTIQVQYNLPFLYKQFRGLPSMSLYHVIQ